MNPDQYRGGGTEAGTTLPNDSFAKAETFHPFGRGTTLPPFLKVRVFYLIFQMSRVSSFELVIKKPRRDAHGVSQSRQRERERERVRL